MTFNRKGTRSQTRLQCCGRCLAYFLGGVRKKKWRRKKLSKIRWLSRTCHACVTTKTDEQIIRKIARICDIKSVAGRICGTDKFLAWSETLKEGKQMRVVTMKMKNCHVRTEVKVRETEFQQKVQEVDYKIQRQGDTYRKEWFSNRSRLVHFVVKQDFVLTQTQIWTVRIYIRHLGRFSAITALRFVFHATYRAI